MLDKLISAYKNKRKQGFLDLAGSYNHQYAFVGVGAHSMNNLYTVIDYLRIPLKYIVTRTENNATKMALRYGAEGTTDLDKVLKDPEIKGVFICSNPKVHFELSKKVLKAGKELFIEKPPCLTSAELKELIGLAENRTCVVGLQKRYSVINAKLQAKLKSPVSYNYKYGLGLYPEGSELLDLFIHPIDNVCFLFGKIKDVQFKVLDMGKGAKTYHVILEHDNGAMGNLELSTAYTWGNGVEELVITSSNGIWKADYPNYLEFEAKPGSIVGVPLEKVLGASTNKEVIFHNNGKQPIMAQNEIYVQGYFDEIKTFVDLCEGRKATNASDLKSLVSTYGLIDQLGR